MTAETIAMPIHLLKIAKIHPYTVRTLTQPQTELTQTHSTQTKVIMLAQTTLIIVSTIIQAQTRVLTISLI